MARAWGNAMVSKNFFIIYGHTCKFQNHHPCVQTFGIITKPPETGLCGIQNTVFTGKSAGLKFKVFTLKIILSESLFKLHAKVGSSRLV